MKPAVAARPGRPKDVKDTRERCLVAAELRFADQGFQGTTLRDVAAAIGATSATIIHHFGTKERLYGRVLERLVASLDEYVGPTEGCSAEIVCQMFERFLDWSLDHQHYAQLLLRELMENRSRVSRAKRLHLMELVSSYVARVREGQAQGRFRSFDAELFAFYTFGAITHFSAAAPTIQRMVEDARTVERFRATLRESVLTMLGEKP